MMIVAMSSGGSLGFVDIQSVYPRTADCRLLSM